MTSRPDSTQTLQMSFSLFTIILTKNIIKQLASYPPQPSIINYALAWDVYWARGKIILPEILKSLLTRPLPPLPRQVGSDGITGSTFWVTRRTARAAGGTDSRSVHSRGNANAIGNSRLPWGKRLGGSAPYNRIWVFLHVMVYFLTMLNMVFRFWIIWVQNCWRPEVKSIWVVCTNFLRAEIFFGGK